jgi:hypothetical protein
MCRYSSVPPPPPPFGVPKNIVKGFTYIVEYTHENFKILKYREKFQISFERQENLSILFLHYVPNFGRVFLMLNYTEKTQNTYIQS